MKSMRFKILFALCGVGVLVAVFLPLIGAAAWTPTVLTIMVAVSVLILGQRIIFLADAVVRSRRGVDSLRRDLDRGILGPLEAISKEAAQGTRRLSIGLSGIEERLDSGEKTLIARLGEIRHIVESWQKASPERPPGSAAYSDELLVDAQLVQAMQIYALQEVDRALSWPQVREIGRALSVLPDSHLVVVGGERVIPLFDGNAFDHLEFAGQTSEYASVTVELLPEFLAQLPAVDTSYIFVVDLPTADEAVTALIEFLPERKHPSPVFLVLLWPRSMGFAAREDVQGYVRACGASVLAENIQVSLLDFTSAKRL